MKHQLNWTGRKKISPRNIDISITEGKDGSQRRFVADFEGLSKLDVREDARIIVEPYIKASIMRFDFGTVGRVEQPANTELSELDSTGGIMFRVRLVDASNVPGRILASAERLYAREAGEPVNDRKALLPLKETDLGEAVWELNLYGSATPILMINRRIPEISAKFIGDPILQGAVFPYVLRQIVEAIVGDSEAESEFPWVEEWSLWIEALIGKELPELTDPEEIEGFVDEVIEAFNLRNQFATKSRPVVVAGEAAYD